MPVRDSRNRRRGVIERVTQIFADVFGAKSLANLGKISWLRCFPGANELAESLTSVREETKSLLFSQEAGLREDRRHDFSEAYGSRCHTAFLGERWYGNDADVRFSSKTHNR